MNGDESKEYVGTNTVPTMDTSVAMGAGGQRFNDGESEFRVLRAGVRGNRAFVEISPPNDKLAEVMIQEIERKDGTFDAAAVARAMADS